MSEINLELIMKVIKDLESKIDKRFDGVDKRLDGIDKRLDNIETKLDHTTEEVARCREDIHGMQNEKFEVTRVK